VLDRCGTDPPMKEGRDHHWSDLIETAEPTCPVESMDSEDPLFILYTSGSTARPKGVLHTTGGYLTQASATHRMVFDLREDDIYWCSADVGWVTGHSYRVDGPLANGATSVMYEGAPDFPERDRWWEIIARYGVTILYTAPTAIRTFMKWGDELPAGHDLSSLRLLGSVGEPINPEAWLWYRDVIGGGRCPVVDTWWQTETGGIMISPLPAITVTKPGSATVPLPGISAAILDEEGRTVGAGKGGNLVIDRPWPGMARSLYREPERFVETYWTRFGRATYQVGDAAFRDEDGYYWIVGRLDDVINVSGHRLSTMEVEAAIDSHPSVAEAAVIGIDDEHTGQALVAFVIPKDGSESGDGLTSGIEEHVADRIGKLARPSAIYYADDLPKTRSGKIMRRLLRDLASGNELGDTTTLRDPEIVEDLKEQVERSR
ncbi:MAG: acetate--CoA ligase, partial [Solirubrobacterales bacterium]